MYIATNKPYAIFVLGAGGTGSWLCSFLDKMSLHNDVIVMDGDIVEPKNVLRQNFKMRDVNANKAEVVGKNNMMSYVHGFITDTGIFHQILEEFPEETIPMLIGCRDNNASRKIASASKKTVKLSKVSNHLSILNLLSKTLKVTNVVPTKSLVRNTQKVRHKTSQQT